MESDASEPAATPPPELPIGKEIVFTPNNPNHPSAADFEASIRGTATPAALGALVPRGTLNTYKPGKRTPEGGFKYEWNDGKSDWVVRGHGPDLEAPPGSNAKEEWTFRVEQRVVGASRGSTRFLTSREVATGQGGRDKEMTRWLGGAKAEVTHIPLMK